MWPPAGLPVPRPGNAGPSRRLAPAGRATVEDDRTDRSRKAAPSSPPARPRAERSLLARAHAYLARREHSRAELRRKLGPHADSAEQLDRLLDDLQARKLLSDERFAEVLARNRGARYGAARIQQELKAHEIGAPLLRAALDELRQTELARAHALWLRRFGAPAADAAERARQMRFLARRGFSTDVIRKVVRARSGADD